MAGASGEDAGVHAPASRAVTMTVTTPTSEEGTLLKITITTYGQRGPPARGNTCSPPDAEGLLDCLGDSAAPLRRRRERIGRLRHHLGRRLTHDERPPG